MSTAPRAAGAPRRPSRTLPARAARSAKCSRAMRAASTAPMPSLLKSCYHPDAIEEHGGNYTGNAFEYIDGAVPRIRKMGVDAAPARLEPHRIRRRRGLGRDLRLDLRPLRRRCAQHRHVHRRPARRPLRTSRRRLEDRAPSHRVRLESRHADAAKAGATGLFDPAKPGMHASAARTSRTRRTSASEPADA